jgi:hypothetical protein
MENNNNTKSTYKSPIINQFRKDGLTENIKCNITITAIHYHEKDKKKGKPCYTFIYKIKLPKYVTYGTLKIYKKKPTKAIEAFFKSFTIIPNKA